MYYNSMKIVTVIPFAKNVFKEALTYYTSKKVVAGNIVKISLRKKEILGLVTHVESGESAKTVLKESQFALKKIVDVLPKQIFNEAFLETVTHVSNYYATYSSLALKQMVPQIILKNLATFPELKKPAAREESTIMTIQAGHEDRHTHYRNCIRENLAQKRSTLIIVPNEQAIKPLRENVHRGIQEHFVTFSPKISKTSFEKKWNETLSKKDPVVIIATAGFFMIPRHDLRSIIVDQEGHSGYVAIQRPYIDMREAIKTYSQKSNLTLIFGDQLLRIETIHKTREQEYQEYSPLTYRALSNAEHDCVDMKAFKKYPSAIVSPDLGAMITQTIEDDKRCVIFAARKGLAPTIVCEDCGQPCTCNSCQSPVVLYGGSDPTKNTNTFTCHSCGDRRPAGGFCPHCQSWKLRPLGIGVETIEQTIKEFLPDAHVLTLSHNNAPTQKKIKEIIEEFYAQPGAILIGTEYMLPHLHHSVEYTAIGSADSLLSIPDFTIHERALKIMVRLRGLAQEKFLIQTRLTEIPLFKHAVEGNLLSFFKDEIKARKQFGYPPYSLFIKITRAAEKETVEAEMRELEKFFQPHNLHVYPAFVAYQKGNYVMNGLLRLKPEEWPNEELLKKLRMLPPSYRVEVDTKRLL
jgi:primosomal protein N' (replication factor Y)